MKSLRMLFPRAILLASLLLVSSYAEGQQPSLKKLPDGFPSKPVTMIGWWGAGGGMDTMLRALAGRFREVTGVPLVIVPGVEGGMGVTALDQVNKEPADGYTLMDGGPEFIINAVTKRGNVDYRQWQPVVRIQRDRSMIHVSAQTQFKQFKDLVEHAKQSRQIWGGIGVGGLDEILAQSIASAAGIRIKYVPYRGVPEAVAALLGGHIHAYHDELGPVVANLEAKQIRSLVVLSETRLASMPDVPTSVELGYPVTSGRIRALGAKKGTPKDRVWYLYEAFKASMDTDLYRTLEKKWHLEYAPGSPDDLQRDWDRDFKIYSEALKALGQAQ